MSGILAITVKSDGRLTYSEFFNWIVHVYEPIQIGELTAALRLYRSLERVQREDVDRQIQNFLKVQLRRNISPNVFGHYRTKIRDLMTAFATTTEFEFKGDGETPFIQRT